MSSQWIFLYDRSLEVLPAFCCTSTHQLPGSIKTPAVMASASMSVLGACCSAENLHCVITVAYHDGSYLPKDVV